MPKHKDKKYLQQRHNIWWLYYKLPKELLQRPEYENHPPLYTQNLKTDSLKEAKEKRNNIIFMLNNVPTDKWEEARKIMQRDSDEFDKLTPHIAGEYADFAADWRIEKAEKEFGVDKETGHPLDISENDAFWLSVFTGRKPDKSRMLRFITNKVIEEMRAKGKAPKTLLKIRRGTDWFLEHLVQDDKDIDISLITFNQVQEFATMALKEGIKGSTINGHLYGPRTAWNRAKQSKLVEGDNPFREHGIPKAGKSYDPFRYEEVFALYRAAEGELKTLIHAAATTGARINELRTAEILTPSNFDHPCWLFKFKDKGKTAQSTRAVPVHSSLQLPEGFKFKISDRTAGRQLKELKEQVIVRQSHELTGQPRKLSFHSFRTTVITYLTGDKRHSEKVVDAITGHNAGSSNLGSINTYINPDNLEMLRQIVEEISWDA